MKNKFLFLPTLKINLLRGFFSGIAISILSLFIPGPPQPFYIFLLIPFFMPIFNLFWFILSYALELFKLGWAASIILFFSSVLGDPLLFILFKIKPEWQPIDKFNFINFAGMIRVYETNIPQVKRNDGNNESQKTPQPQTDNRTCSSCKYWAIKSLTNPNNECKKGRNPENGYAKACSEYQEPFSIGQTDNSCDNCVSYDFSNNCKQGFIVPKSKAACVSFEEK